MKAFVKLARDVAAEIEQKRLLEFGKCAAKEQRVRAGMFVRLEDGLHQQRFRFAGAGRAAEETVFRGRGVELCCFGNGRYGSRTRAAEFSRAEDASRDQRSMPDVIVIMEDWPRRHGDTEERLTAILCGVRRLAAAVCRTGLPGRAATASQEQEPPGQAPAKREREQAPALHIRLAMPGERGV